MLFLIIAGTYVSGIGTLTIPPFFSISLSIIGVVSYIVYLFMERNYILTYFQWLKTEVRKRIKFETQGVEPPTGSGQGSGGQSTTVNGRRAGGRYGSSESEQSEDDSQGTTQPDADWMYNPNHLTSAAVEHIPLPVIHEGSESLDQTATNDLENGSAYPPPPSHPHRPNGVLPLPAGARLVQGAPRPTELEQADDTDNELSQVNDLLVLLL